MKRQWIILAVIILLGLLSLKCCGAEVVKKIFYYQSSSSQGIICHTEEGTVLLRQSPGFTNRLSCRAYQSGTIKDNNGKEYRIWCYVGPDKSQEYYCGRKVYRPKRK